MAALDDARNMMARLPDWEPRLIALVNERRRLPYRYGTNDCAVFAQLAVEAVTGTVLLPGVERPTGMISAAKFMIARGWDDVEQMATELLGPPTDGASRRGDIVSYEAVGELHLAVRVGDGALSPVGDIGLMAIEPARWRRAWRVG